MVEYLVERVYSVQQAVCTGTGEALGALERNGAVDAAVNARDIVDGNHQATSHQLWSLIAHYLPSVLLDRSALCKS